MSRRLEKLMVGMLIFSIVVVSLVFVIGDINHNYGTDIGTSDLTGVYDTINDTYNITQDIEGKAIDAELSTATDETWNSMVKGSYSGVRSPFKMAKGAFSILGSIFNSLARTLGVPSYFIVFTITIIFITLVFGIIYLVMRSDGE